MRHKKLKNNLFKEKKILKSNFKKIIWLSLRKFKNLRELD
jgi:hypothetical protein